jgi:hypothetical protein
MQLAKDKAQSITSLTHSAMGSQTSNTKVPAYPSQAKKSIIDHYQGSYQSKTASSTGRYNFNISTKSTLSLGKSNKCFG